MFDNKMEKLKEYKRLCDLHCYPSGDFDFCTYKKLKPLCKSFNVDKILILCTKKSIEIAEFDFLLRIIFGEELTELTNENINLLLEIIEFCHMVKISSYIYAKIYKKYCSDDKNHDFVKECIKIYKGGNPDSLLNIIEKFMKEL